MNKEYTFEAVIEEDSSDGGAWVVFPWNIKQEFGKGRVKVFATFDGIPYSGSIVNMGLRDEAGNVLYVIGVLKSVRQKLNKKAGDKVHVTVVERD